MVENSAIGERVRRLRKTGGAITGIDDDLSRFFANSLGMLCIVGLDGYFKRLNPAWKNTLGWTLEELYGRPFLEFIHPDDRAATLSEVDKLARGGRTLFFENRYRCKDGSYKWLQWNANSSRARRQIYAIARDVTTHKNLEDEILQASDRQKAHLGRELHDGLCQTLAGIAALSAALSRQLAARSASAASAAAAEITALLNEAIGEAHDLAHGLGPVGLQEAGLAGALEGLALTVQHRFRVACTLACEKLFPRLGPEVEAHLFRIAQEAVNNAITHGRAKRIDISLSGRGGDGLLSIRDNGVGISQQAATGEGIGLHTMDYRSRLIGASLQVQRGARRGTAVTCAFHLPPAAPPTERRHARTKS